MDYPVKTWKIFGSNGSEVSIRAGIECWTMMNADGSTKKLAIKALRESFKAYKENNDDLPRPGTNVPLKLAPTDHIDRFEKTAVHFFDKILGMNYYEGFYSDGTVLLYFEPDDESEAIDFKRKIILKTQTIYKVDISDFYDEPIWKIFELIESEK
ncbi:hypothetical protein V8G61_14500 [Gaetbulibacter sp. M240]|uniref:hypothetical protein n=1 Tax=Gaetbulibacter sp. M240 TaxID=3126511 RepID=UPI00374F3158